MKQVLCGLLFALGLFVLPGCGDGGPQNVIEGASEEALEDYDRMIAEEEAAMNEEMEGNLE